MSDTVVNLPFVYFNKITICEDAVRDMISVSRTVSRWNGNHVGSRPITLVTDNYTLVKDALVESDRYHATLSLANESSALFWPDSGVIWLKPDKSNDEQIRSLAHETAHAIVPGHHPQRWRRMYALLLPLWWRRFRPWDRINMCQEMTHVVGFYAGNRLSALRRADEVGGHVIAGQRAMNRWGHLVR